MTSNNVSFRPFGKNGTEIIPNEHHLERSEMLKVLCSIGADKHCRFCIGKGYVMTGKIMSLVARDQTSGAERQIKCVLREVSKCGACKRSPSDLVALANREREIIAMWQSEDAAHIPDPNVTQNADASTATA